ncbi:hypothetical protein U0070_006061 [Myodes glareolus]|uniref:Uncharacterized protein n=1 Tax=Myodes glareolus TaxID=447135 RepID=A0AAW0IAH1_MYOGA
MSCSDAAVVSLDVTPDTVTKGLEDRAVDSNTEKNFSCPSLAEDSGDDPIPLLGCTIELTIFAGTQVLLSLTYTARASSIVLLQGTGATLPSAAAGEDRVSSVALERVLLRGAILSSRNERHQKREFLLWIR